jgi:hypothetical protein
MAGAFVEELEPGVSSLTPQPSDVDLLEDDSELPCTEYEVPVNPTEVSSGVFTVSTHRRISIEPS